MNGLIWSVSGADEILDRAVTSAKQARPAGIGDALAQTQRDHSLRAHRSLVLGSVCAETDLAEQWLREDPDCPDALLLYARVAVTRAIRAVDAKDKQRKGLVEIARRACFAAVRGAEPSDPTPWSASLALARLAPRWAGATEGGRTAAGGVLSAAELVGIVGPWRLLDAVRERDANHREAHHWVLQGLAPRFGGSVGAMFAYARHIRELYPLDADPQILPLVACAETYRSGGDAGVAGWTWARSVRQVAQDLYERGWFDRVQQLRYPPIQDLSYLAHALYVSGQIIPARAVFEAMGPYATAAPWLLVGDARAEVRRAREQCGATITGASWRNHVAAAAVNLHPAGCDAALEKAMAAAGANRPSGIAEALAGTAGDFELRAHRSRLLGAVCAGTDLAEQWLGEEPGNSDAQLLYARVAVARALGAFAAGDTRWQELARMALRACQKSISGAGKDPTPRAVILDLARLGFTPERIVLGTTSRSGPHGAVGVSGPWPYLRAALKLDPFHREAHENFLRCLSPRFGGSFEQMRAFADYVYASTTRDSDLKLLSLSVCVAEYRDLRLRREPADQLWNEYSMVSLLDELFLGGWFRQAKARRFPPVADLSALAFGMFMSRRYLEAHQVLESIAPHADPMPWKLLGDPGSWVRWARSNRGASLPLPPPVPDP